MKRNYCKLVTYCIASPALILTISAASAAGSCSNTVDNMENQALRALLKSASLDSPYYNIHYTCKPNPCGNLGTPGSPAPLQLVKVTSGSGFGWHNNADYSYKQTALYESVDADKSFSGDRVFMESTAGFLSVKCDAEGTNPGAVQVSGWRQFYTNEVAVANQSPNTTSYQCSTFNVPRTFENFWYPVGDVAPNSTATPPFCVVYGQATASTYVLPYCTYEFYYPDLPDNAVPDVDCSTFPTGATENHITGELDNLGKD